MMKRKKEKITKKIVKSKNYFLFFSIFDIIKSIIGMVGGIMNRKGQALVEFVLIMPVLIFIIFVIVDFGTIFNNRSSLSSVSDDIVDMYKNGDSIDDIKNIYKDVNIELSNYKEKYVKIKIEKSVNLVTPGLGKILDDPFIIKVERVINEA